MCPNHELYDPHWVYEHFLSDDIEEYAPSELEETETPDTEQNTNSVLDKSVLDDNSDLPF